MINQEYAAIDSEKHLTFYLSYCIYNAGVTYAEPPASPWEI